MSDFELIIGTKTWSSWSLRPWLALKQTGAPFVETLVGLRRDDTAQRIAALSPSSRVPVLRHGDLLVWDSLAICEYLAEQFPAAKLWPDDAAARAVGRSAAAEMHSGFSALRRECPMDIGARIEVDLSDETRANIARIVEIWMDLRARFGDGGPFLLGAWSIADAFFAPVATRFRTYRVDPAAYGDDGSARAYCSAVLSTPAFLEWESAARAES